MKIEEKLDRTTQQLHKAEAKREEALAKVIKLTADIKYLRKASLRYQKAAEAEFRALKEARAAKRLDKKAPADNNATA